MVYATKQNNRQKLKAAPYQVHVGAVPKCA